MKIIHQQKLLSSVLSSDILYFAAGSSNIKNSSSISKQLKLKKKNNYIVLNVETFVQSIKQLIRLLQYNSNHYHNFLQIVSSNTLYNEIIDQVCKKYNKTTSSVNVRKKLDININSKCVLFIGTDKVNNLYSLLLKGFTNNINSVFLLNSDFNKNLFGNYKIFADINSYKKLLFIMSIVLLSQTSLNKNK